MISVASLLITRGIQTPHCKACRRDVLRSDERFAELIDDVCLRTIVERKAQIATAPDPAATSVNYAIKELLAQGELVEVTG